MNGRWLDDELNRALRRDEEPQAPDFESTLAGAAAALVRQQRRRQAGVALAAAAAIAAVTLVSRSPTGLPANYEFAIDEALLTATRWQAPSDVLMPQHRLDLYLDMPAMPVSTDLEEGTLL